VTPFLRGKPQHNQLGSIPGALKQDETGTVVRILQKGSKRIKQESSADAMLQDTAGAFTRASCSALWSLG